MNSEYNVYSLFMSHSLSLSLIHYSCHTKGCKRERERESRPTILSVRRHGVYHAVICGERFFLGYRLLIVEAVAPDIGVIENGGVAARSGQVN